MNEFDINSSYKYPDLLYAIARLRDLMEEVDEQHHSLLNKWIEQLEKVQKEMRHLERIEKFSTALTTFDEDDDELEAKEY